MQNLRTAAGQWNSTQDVNMLCGRITRPSLQVIRCAIKERQQTYDGGSIYGGLSIASSVYYTNLARQKHPHVRSAKDRWLCDKFRWVWKDNFCVYGARKVWHQLRCDSMHEGAKASLHTIVYRASHMWACMSQYGTKYFFSAFHSCCKSTLTFLIMQTTYNLQWEKPWKTV